MIRLSIIIPAYNAAQYVERCLLSINNEAIRSGISQSEYEIIIVDDCSSDNTIEGISATVAFFAPEIVTVPLSLCPPSIAITSSDISIQSFH